jgi:hypothetical protein
VYVPRLTSYQLLAGCYFPGDVDSDVYSMASVLER